MSVDIQYLLEKKDMIAVFDGLINPSVCDRLVAELRPIWNTISWDGKTGGGLLKTVKSSRDCALSTDKIGIDRWNNTFEFVEQHIVEGLSKAVAWYKAEFQSLHGWTAVSDTGFQLQQYPQNYGFYREHVDSMPDDWTSNRVLGCVVYLNTIEVGGETDFPMHGASVKPVSGRIALFPATFTHPHVGRPALSEDKWIISTFVCNKAATTQDETIAPYTSFDDELSHPHDEHGNHIHDNHISSAFDQFDPTDKFEWQEPGVVNAQK